MFDQTEATSLNFDLAMVASGEYTMGYDAVGGHMDELGRHALENKICLPLGVVSKDHEHILLEDGMCGLVPPGFLAFPQYKICVQCWALEDIQLHDPNQDKS